MNGSVSAAVLGSADGVTSIAGVIAGGAAAHVSHVALGVTAVGGALAATVSMGGAEMLAQDTTDWPAVAAMGVGTLGGSALPALPLLVASGPVAWLAIVGLSIGFGVAVGAVRARTTHRSFWTAAAQTLGVLAAGGLVGFGAGRFL